MTADTVVYHLTHQALKSSDPEATLSILYGLLSDAASDVFDATPINEVSQHAHDLRVLARYVDGIYVAGSA